MRNFNFQGSAAAITGAASGIGRALALELAARGCDLALCDLDTAGLESLAKEIASGGPRRVTTRRVDVGDPGQIHAFAEAAIADFPAVNILINNAGVALLGQFEEYDQAQLEWLMGINFWGVVHGTRAFLPQLRSRPEAHIVNISSIFGIIAPAGQTAYSAAKFAVRGFSEALRHELATANSPVRLSVVHPGGVKTNIARKARAGAHLREVPAENDIGDRFEQMARTTPAAAAQRIVRGIERNEPRILIGGDARLLDIIQRFRPASYWSLLQGVFRRMSDGDPAKIV
ncbi:MAG TPA: SDR family NAD(P)-dependent oxidoreductase [Steroidobacteraceae bacterium]